LEAEKMTDERFYSFLLWEFIGQLLVNGHVGVMSNEARRRKALKLWDEIIEILKKEGLKIRLKVDFDDTEMPYLYREATEKFLNLAKTFEKIGK
jgi:hypothetical protein